MLQAAAGFLAALYVCLAFAQDDAVVVTATRFPDAKRDLPVGVTLITADDIQKSASSNLAEILAQFGLVNIRDNSGTPNQQIDLRGFGITGDQNTLLMVDGIRLSENELSSAQLSTIPLETIERIEIVRGSGAVLYGGGASGGTINVITRRAEPGKATGYGVGRVGGYGTRELRTGYRGMEQRLGISQQDAHVLDALDRLERNRRELRRFEIAFGEPQAIEQHQRVLVAGDAEAAQVELRVLCARQVANLQQAELGEDLAEIR